MRRRLFLCAIGLALGSCAGPKDGEAPKSSKTSWLKEFQRTHKRTYFVGVTTREGSEFKAGSTFEPIITTSDK